MRLCRCSGKPGRGQREGRETWMGRERRGPSRFRAAVDPQNKCGPRRLGGGRAPRGVGRSRPTQRRRPQLLSPPAFHYPRASSLEKEGNLSAKGDGLHLLLQTAGREGLPLRGVYDPHCRFTSSAAPDSALRTPQLAPLSGPSRCDLGSGAGVPGGVRPTPPAVRASEPERAGTDGCARGGARGRRSGRDTCGGGGAGGDLGARGFKKVWRGAGAFPGLTEGRRAEAALAAAHRGGGRRALGIRSPGPALPRPKETLGAAVSRPTSRRDSASELALLPSAAFSPSLRVAPSSRRLQNWMSQRRSGGAAAAWSAVAGPRGLSSWRCCWGRRWGRARRWAITPASRPSFSCAPTTGSWKGMGSRARCSFPCTLRETPPTTYRDKNTMVGTTASPRLPPGPVRPRAQRFLLFLLPRGHLNKNPDNPFSQHCAVWRDREQS